MELTTGQARRLNEAFLERDTPLDQLPVFFTLKNFLVLRELSYGKTIKTKDGAFSAYTTNKKANWDGTVTITHLSTKNKLVLSVKVYPTTHAHAKPRIQMRAVTTNAGTGEVVTRNHRRRLNPEIERTMRKEVRKTLSDLSIPIPDFDWLVETYGGK